MIGWWLAGIPQYVVAGVFIGGGAAAWTWTDHSWQGPSYVGLISLLVFVSVIVLSSVASTRARSSTSCSA